MLHVTGTLLKKIESECSVCICRYGTGTVLFLNELWTFIDQLT
jgi:hypothetical protein